MKNKKKTIKQIFSLLLTILMVSTAVISVLADGIIMDPSSTYNSFLYIMLSDGTCAITGYGGLEEVINIPEEVNGIPVTAMAEIQFSRYLFCDVVNIGPHVKKIIGNNVYMRASNNQKTINIVADELEIGDYAWWRMNSLEKVTIEGYVKSIGEYVLAECKKLKEVILPEGITTIPEGMFYKCPALESIVLPSTVTKIDEYAFYGCSSLKSVSIPEGIVDIASNAFEGTPADCEIKPIAGDGLFYENGILKSVDKSKINGKVVIRPDTFYIADGAFKDCTGLTEIVSWPNSLTGIGAEAFANCTNLKKIPSLKDVAVYDRAFAGSGIGEVEVNGRVGVEAFKDCLSLTKVTLLGKGSTTYEKECFAGCAVEYVYFPGNIYRIPEGMFAGCNNIKEIMIGNGVTEIGARAFDCDSYTDIILPETLRNVGENAITSAALKDVYYASTEAQFNNLYVGNGNNALRNADLHANTKNIFYQYWDMPSLTDWSYQGFKYCLLNGIMNGTAEHYLSPGVITTRAQLVTLLWRLDGSPEVSDNGKFTDLTADWYASAVNWASSNGIVMGTSETTFTPDRDITRQEAATLLYRYAEYKEYDTGARAELTVFPDHGNVMSFAYDALSWANAEGLITGVSNYSSVILDPAGSATRAQIATILMRYSETFH